VDDLPPLYARWMRAQVGFDLPREEVATCDRCVMLPTDAAAPDTTFFEPTTKCCTFLPELHNFLVGQVLAGDDVDPAGRASVIARIELGDEVTPLGLGRSRAFLLVYQDGGELTFGRSRGLRCPHYLDDGRCGVWQHRESTCATWFCKHVRGEVGHELWRAVRRVLRGVEADLAWWCVREQGLDPAAVTALLDRPRRSARSATAEELWGAWRGREPAFYRACAARIDAPEWHDVLAICGPPVAAAAGVLTGRARAAQATALPTRLRLRTLTVTGITAGACTVTTYNAYDPISVPLGLLEVLDAFDGRPVDEVLLDLARDRGVELDPGLLARLVDFGVLAALPG